MKRTHDEIIQNVKAELEARDLCMNAIYALRELTRAVEQADEAAVAHALEMASKVLNSNYLSTRKKE